MELVCQAKSIWPFTELAMFRHLIAVCANKKQFTKDACSYVNYLLFIDELTVSIKLIKLLILVTIGSRVAMGIVAPM